MMRTPRQTSRGRQRLALRNGSTNTTSTHLRLGLAPTLLVLLFPLLLLLGACGGSSAARDSNERQRPSDASIVVIEGCEEYLRRIRGLDLSTLAEPELEALLEEALTLHPTCAEHYPRVATTTVDRVLYGHRADQIDLHALWLELEISRRFDDGAGTCSIISDAFALLLGNVQTIDQALAKPELPAADIRRLHELRTLDLQAIDVLYLSFEQFCQP